jgi:hypothetical protein
MNEALEQVDTITNKFSELLDIMKRPTSQGLPDLIQWVERNGKSLGHDLGDLKYMIEFHMEQVAIEGQMKLNHDLDRAVEMKVSA